MLCSVCSVHPQGVVRLIKDRPQKESERRTNDHEHSETIPEVSCERKGE